MGPMHREDGIRLFGYFVPGFIIVAASSWLSRLLTAAVSLVSIRILLDTLGVEHYAVYVTIMGAVSWFMLADMGMGQSLQNYISEARAAKQGYDQHILVTSAITFVIVVIGIVLVAILSGCPANLLLRKFGCLTYKEKYLSFALVAGLVILTAGGSLVYKIWYAEHKGYLANIAAALASIVALGGLYCVSQSGMENKLLWCLIAANVPMAILAVSSLMVRVWNTPRVSAESIGETGRKIFKRGVKFWLFNISAAAVFQIDYIVLSQFARADQILIYNIGAKIFITAGFFYSAVLQAFWPVCAEAIVRGDWKEISTFTLKYLVWGIVFLVMFTAGIVIFRTEIALLFSSQGLLKIPIPFILSLGLMYVIRIWTDVFAVILQSMNDIKMLLKWAVLQAAIGFGLQILLVPTFGIYGTVAALSLSWLLTVSWLLPKRVWKHKQRMLECQT